MKNKLTDFLKSPLFKKLLVAGAATAAATAATALTVKVLKHRKALSGTAPKGTLPRAKNIYIGGNSIAALAAAAYLIKDGGYDGSSIHVYGSVADGVLSEEYGSIGKEFLALMKAIYACSEDGVSICDMIENSASTPEPTIRIIDGSGKVRALDITPDRATLKAVNKALKKMASGEKLDDISISEYFKDMREIFDTDLFDFIEMSFGLRDEHKASEFIKRAEQVLTEAPETGFYDTLYYDFSTAAVLEQYLKDNNVDYHPNAEFTSMDISDGHIGAIHLIDDGTRMTIYLNTEDRVIFSAGNISDNASEGSASETAALIEEVPPSLPLWAQAATGDDNFGIPELLLENVGDSMEFSIVDESNFLTEKICSIIGEAPENGIALLLTGSNWRMKLSSEARCTIAADETEVDDALNNAVDAADDTDAADLTEDDLKAAKAITAEAVNTCINVKGMYCSSYGNFVEKSMRECTGMELLYELCGHLGIIDEWEKILKSVSIIEVVNYPYRTAPLTVVPEHTRPELMPCDNCCVIGSFMGASAPAITLEQEVVSAKNAVYALMGVKAKKGFFR